jgi:hypothetical protein
MPHNWLNAPRLFNRLIHPNVSFSKRELAVWGTASSQSVPAPTLGLFCRTDVAADRALSRDEWVSKRGAGRKTSPVIAIRLLAIGIYQKLRAKTMASTARADTMAPLGEGFGPRPIRRVASKKTQAISLTRVRNPPHGRVEKGPGPGRPARRPRYFFRGGADGGAAGGTSSPRPPKMSCFQRSKRESAILTRCVFSGPISCAAITLPSGLATPSPLA